MPRRIANGLTLLSAVVCVGSALLVARTFFIYDQLSVQIGRGCYTWQADTFDGQLFLLVYPFPSSAAFFHAEHQQADAAASRSDVSETWEDTHGIRWIGIGWYSKYSPWNYVILPLWLLPLLTAIAPVRWWRRRRREAGRGFVVDVSRAQTTTANS